MKSSTSLELVHLDRDHPGFRDASYRARRNEIARLALEHQPHQPAPVIEYTSEEHAVWAVALTNLAPLHRRYACAEFLECWAQLPFSPHRVPQFAEVNAHLQPQTDFRLSPVAGLVSARTFMEHLSAGVFLATQYMRHHSTPLYTPEPDVIHELVGHVALLADPRFARLNRWFGEACARAKSEARIQQLISLYWYTLEFGVVQSPQGLKVVGAGLLSSFGELGRFESQSELRPFRVEEVAATPFDPTDYQRTLFVAPSLDALEKALEDFLLRSA